MLNRQEITSSLLSVSKSISISGIVIIFGFKNLSKDKLNLIGSKLVISNKLQTNDSPALPLDGPILILFFLAKEI